MANKIKLQLIKSLIGRKPKHKLIAQELGLTRIRKEVLVNDNPCMRGKINKISYLLQIEETK